MSSDSNVRAGARALGWIGIGVGLAELLAPRATALRIGRSDRRGLLPWCGLRELITGVGAVTARDPAAWVWARVAGDMLDLAALTAPGARTTDAADRRLAATFTVTLGVTLLDLYCALALNGADRRRVRYVRRCGVRSGFPAAPEQMRGAARADFTAPDDFVTPRAMRPYPQE